MNSNILYAEPDKKIVLQVKYCYTEKEVNDFLSTLEIKNLHSVTYVPKVQGESKEDTCVMGSDITAVVQYFNVTKVDKE